MTTTAGWWATRQVGQHGRTVAEIAVELGTDWHTINSAVIAYGEALLKADVDRIPTVRALALDEAVFKREGRSRTQCWSTQLTDARTGQLLDLVEGGDAASPAAWLAARDPDWVAGIRWGVLDLSGPYRSVFDTMCPDAGQVADPFHVVKLAGSKLDECRRRVQNETLGRRGRKGDPLYRCRRLLLKAEERLDPNGSTKLAGLLRAGDPRGEVAYAWRSDQQSRQASEAGCLRVPTIPELPEPVTALRRTTRLEPARHHHTRGSPVRYFPGQSLDHKGYVGEHWGFRQTIEIDGVRWEMYYEIWSNIHFGYVNERTPGVLPNAVWYDCTQRCRGVGISSDLDMAYMEFGNELARATTGGITRQQLLDALGPALQEWANANPRDKLKPKKLDERPKYRIVVCGLGSWPGLGVGAPFGI